MSETTAQPASVPAEAPAQEPTMADIDALLRADEEAEQSQDQEPETEAEPPLEPEAAAAPPEKPADDLPVGDLRVPLREERERRRQAEQYAAQLAASQKAIGTYLEQMARQVRPQDQPNQPPAPDFDSDPAGYLRHQLEALRGGFTELAQARQAEAQAKQAERAVQSAVMAVSNHEAAFAQKQADYYDAVDFMRERQAAKFEALGMPKEQIPNAVQQEMRNFGLKALQTGMNPAQALFQLAKVEGYNGPRVNAAAKLDTIARGAAATRGARSSAPASSGGMTAEQAANLSYKELGKMSDDDFRRLMGG